MQEKVTINGTSYCVGLSDVYGGVMWFCCKCSQDKSHQPCGFEQRKNLRDIYARYRTESSSVKYYPCCARYTAGQSVTHDDTIRWG